jgi:predicted nucleic acid-binding protein
LGNQRSILHQLYNLVLTTTQTREELERSWKTLVQEEEREILRRQRRDERQIQRDQAQNRN